MNRLLFVCVVTSLRVFAAEVPVSTVTELRAALQAARAGDVITLADGTYVTTSDFSCSANGTAQQPIIVRAANQFGAKLELATTEGFKVSGKHWQFEGLELRGTCANDADCEHAFHVTGDADDFVMRGNRVVNFNAQLKANAAQVSGVWQTPDRGLIERNELFDTRARNTGNPTTKLNIDTGDDWVVRGNFIHDFQKGGGDGVSYGAFMKSGGKRGVFEKNLVICQAQGAHTGGTRIGLSFGGGGTGNAFCAPAFDANVTCDPEHTDGTLRNNVVVGCSDVAVYLNEATNTKVLHNTFIGTNGVDYRFATSTGLAQGNLLASVVRARNGGTFTGLENVTGVSGATFEGYYQSPAIGDLRIKGDVSALHGVVTALSEVPDDFCGRARPAGARTVGALEHSSGSCETVWAALLPVGGGGGSTPVDAGAGGGGGSALVDAGAGGGGGSALVDAGAGGGGAAVVDAGSGGGGDATTEPSGCGCMSTDGVWLLALLTLLRRR